MNNKDQSSKISVSRITASGGVLAAVGVAGVSAISPANAQVAFENTIFFPSVNDVLSVQHHELTGDGLIDFVTLEKYGKVMIFQSVGDGQFIVNTKIEGRDHLRDHLRVGDVDGNGTPDYVWNEDTTLFIYYTQPDGSMLRVQTFEDSLEPIDLELGDIDHDGDLDIITTSENTTRVFMNRGQNGFTLFQSLVLVDPTAMDMVTGDFDFDGDLDIATLTSSYSFDYYGDIKVYDSHISVFLNNGTGTFNTETHFQLPYGNEAGEDLNPKRLAVGDLDNDGDQDFAVTVSGTYFGYNSEILLLENLGDSASFQVNSRTEYDVFGPIEMADLDLDGDLDIVASSPGDFTTFNNKGNFRIYQSFQSMSYLTGFARSIQIDDFNQDGMPDVLIGGGAGTALYINRDFTRIFLKMGPLVQGQTTKLTITAADPDHTVYALYRRGLPLEEAPEPTIGGLILEVGNQFRLAGMTVADNLGVAKIKVHVPSDAPLDLITMQAVMKGNPDGTRSEKSNYHTTRIQEQ